MQIEAEAGNLAALMVMRPDLEPLPEPFRMQPSLHIIVGFNEYIQFIRRLPSEVDVLYTPISKLKAKVEDGKLNELVRPFYLDMALAVGKEIFFAESCGAAATCLRHSFPNCKTTYTAPLRDDIPAILLGMLEQSGHRPKSLSPANSVHWTYACRLLQSAMDSVGKWVEK